MTQTTQPPRCAFCGINPIGKICADTPTALPAPALDQLLRSNSIPTRGMETLVKSQLACVQDRIKTLDEAICNLQEARSLLEQEKANLASVLSPVRRAPPEILSEIFILYSESWWERLSEWQLRGALPNTNEYMGWDDFEGAEEWDGWVDARTRTKGPDRDLTELRLRPTTVLSGVCHSWRAAARACSSLWSNISLHHNYRPPSAQSLLKEQLHLSANRPLRIHASYQVTHYHHLFPLLRTILPTSHRWTSIDMVIGDIDHPVFSRDNISFPFPSLVSLSLILQNSRNFDQSDYFGHVYKITAADAPLLREVSLGWPNNAPLSFDLPWAQLHKLRFWGEDGAYAVEIISKLREIVELDLLGLTDYDDSLLNELPLRSLQLPFLRCLRLSNVGCNCSGTPSIILPYLQVPSLQTLCWTGPKLLEMKELYKMCAPQNSIRFGEAPAEAQMVLRHLHLYNPTREALEVRGHCRDESWRLLLDAVGPQLESFKVEYPTSSGANASEVVEYLVSRIRGGHLPHFHTCVLQGVHISSRYLADLITCVESHKCDIRVLNCTFDTQEELDDACMTKLQESFPDFIPDGAFFELDVEAPNRMRLFYTSEFGKGLRESCECGLEGMSLRQDNRSNVLRVVQ